jgi:hypothetical protein
MKKILFVGVVYFHVTLFGHAAAAAGRQDAKGEWSTSVKSEFVVIAKSYRQDTNPFHSVVVALKRRHINAFVLPITPPYLYVKSRAEAKRSYGILEKVQGFGTTFTIVRSSQ